MTKNSKTSFDLNLLLRVANIFIYGLIVFLYNIKNDNNLVNIFTLLLVGLFVIENIGMLSHEKRRRNPFILILVLVMTVFYIFRVATLILIPSSGEVIFEDASLTATDLNYALIFILLSNAAMFLGFFIGDNDILIHKNISYTDDPVPKVYNAVIIISLCALIQFFNVINQEAFGRLSIYVQAVFFNPHIILLFSFALLAYHYNKISLRIRIVFIVMLFAIVLLFTLSGSRAGVLTVGMLLLMGTLAVKQRIMISKKNILICLIIIPISMVFFVTATLKRELEIKDTITVKHLYKINEEEVFSYDRVEDHLEQIFYRLGYLDWSTELISDRQKFAKIINARYYFKSIIDNVLTPGFDVFGTPKASHALSYVRRGESIPDNDQISLHYQADQMGIYGEYYVLFYGYPALAVFFCLAFMFQMAYVNLKTSNALLTCLYRAVLINLFYIHLNSFGIDWFGINILATVITASLFAGYFVSNKKRKFFFMIQSEK